MARGRCWRYNWVVDLDIRGFFDNMDHDLLMRAVRKHTDCKWIVLYIERWLKAPVQLVDGTLVDRDKGTPQGGVVSPLLANLFMHYAFDTWMQRNYPHIHFERYADDAVVHCKSGEEASGLKDAIGARLMDCGLELHPDKTKIVYCQDGQRKGSYPIVKFDFLGFCFQPRQSKARWGNLFLNFSPAVSAKAAKSIRQTIRSWKIHRWTHLSIEELAACFNPILRGWINYYGQYYKSMLSPILGQLDYALVRWAKRKYRRLKGSQEKARAWVKGLALRQPQLFVHWQITFQSTTGR
jgi:group II intron reverse transcriptase/maturase